MKKAGALDASSVESEAEMEEIRRYRKPTIIAVIVIFCLSMIVWPLLTLPAGDFRSAIPGIRPAHNGYHDQFACLDLSDVSILQRCSELHWGLQCIAYIAAIVDAWVARLHVVVLTSLFALQSGLLPLLCGHGLCVPLHCILRGDLLSHMGGSRPHHQIPDRRHLPGAYRKELPRQQQGRQQVHDLGCWGLMG